MPLSMRVRGEPLSLLHAEDSEEDIVHILFHVALEVAGKTKEEEEENIRRGK